MIQKEECLSQPEGRIKKITQSQQQKERQIKKNGNKKNKQTKKKCKQFERSLGCNIHIIEVPEREEQGNGIKSGWGNYHWILPKPEEENRYPGTENTEVPKQNEHKQTHIKIYHNKNGKS